jgi:hypothetical protein
VTAAAPATALHGFAPLVERAVAIDVSAYVRLRASSGVVAGYVRLPYDIVAGCTLPLPVAESFDVTYAASDFLAWVDGRGEKPDRRDAHWLTPLPPRHGWRRIETVPETDIRAIVRSGAELARTADTRSGQESLLSSTVLRVDDDGGTVEVPLGPLSALTRMGFLPRSGSAAIDVAAGWLRVAARYGSTYVSTGSALGLLGPS